MKGRIEIENTMKEIVKLIPTLMVFIVPASVLSQDWSNRVQPSGMFQEQQYRERLITEFSAYAESYAASRDYLLNQDAQAEFNNTFSRRAADAILKQNPLDHESMRREARKEIKILIDTATQQSQSIYNRAYGPQAYGPQAYGPQAYGVIDRETLSNAILLRCSIWPFPWCN